MMSRKSFFLLMLGAVLCSVQCSEDGSDVLEIELKEEGTVVPELNVPQTRFSVGLDGRTAWEAGDRLQAFILKKNRRRLESPSEENHYQFLVDESNPASGHFISPEGNKLVAGADYAWCVMSPNIEVKHGSGWRSKTEAVAVFPHEQTVARFRDEPAGNVGGAAVLWGRPEELQPGVVHPSVILDQLGTLMKVPVSSGLDGPVTIRQVRFQVPSNIVVAGNFELGIEDGTLSNGAATSSSVVLDVQDADPLLAGDVQTFCMLMHPFGLTAGSRFSVGVTCVDESGVEMMYEKEYTVRRDVDFGAGKMNTVKINLVAEEPVPGPEPDPGTGKINEGGIPIVDGNFWEYLKTANDAQTGQKIDADGDGIITEEEAAVVQAIHIEYAEVNITDIAGIEYFTGMIELKVIMQPNLKELDVSKLKTNLRRLEAFANPVLETIWVWDDFQSGDLMRFDYNQPPTCIRRHLDSKTWSQYTSAWE